MSKSKGLGDTVEKITRATGIKSLTKLAMSATGYKDCGCDKRNRRPFLCPMSSCDLNISPAIVAQAAQSRPKVHAP